MKAYADLAWWFGWTQSAIDDLTVDEFDDWLGEINRQIKAGYRRAA